MGVILVNKTFLVLNEQPEKKYRWVAGRKVTDLNLIRQTKGLDSVLMN